MEPDCKGCRDFAETDRLVQASSAAGIKVIARLDFQPGWTRRDGARNGPPDSYQDYWDFVSAFVSRYAGSEIGRVDAIDIWNEPNIAREWGDQPIGPGQAADYVRLLAGAYQAKKSADPDVIVITAGLAPAVTNAQSADDAVYLQWLYAAGLRGNYDVLGAHANAQAREPDSALSSLSAVQDPSFDFRRPEQLRDIMVRNGDQDKQIWLPEMGWTSNAIHPTYSWFAVSEDKKADNILAAFRFARANWPWMGVMIVWCLPDWTWTRDREEWWWAVQNPGGTPRPALTRILAAGRAVELP